MFVPRAVKQRSSSGPSSTLPSVSESRRERASSTALPIFVEPPALARPSGGAASLPSISRVPGVSPSPNPSPIPENLPSPGSRGLIDFSATALVPVPVPAPSVLDSSSSLASQSAGVLASDGDTSATDLPGAGEDEDNPVTLRSVDQRAAEPGEPSCVVCGRYGEYICDETDDDVCSVECKGIVLNRILDSTNPNNHAGGQLNQKADDPRQQKSKMVVHFRDSLPSMQDDLDIIVRDGEKSLPEWEPDRVIMKLTQQQVDVLRKQTEITVQGDEVPRPILEFSNCKFLPKLQTNLELAGYETPTPVQMQLIPAILKGRDLLVSAGTGSGKTIGYLLSIVFRICLIRSHYQLEAHKPLAIVLTPTRELCVQVEQQAKALAKGLPFKTSLVVGGDAMPQQLYRINQGVELIVGTPGRLIDLLTKHDIQLDDVCMLVLDEVDCMLEHGFRDQVVQIQTALTRPQILMFSATIPASIERFSTSILKRPLLISVGVSSLPSEAVKQTVIWVGSNQKKKKLFDIISSPRHFRPPVVVFVNSRKGAELLAESIQSMTGLEAAAVHGEKPMEERRQVLKAFLTGGLPIVVATGVLGRGLDLLRVTQVIVFDMPQSTQEYIHQIGRASRLGVPGSAMVFINDDSKIMFKDLVELFQRSGVVVPKELLNSPYVLSSYAAAYNPRKRKAHYKDKR